MIQSLYWLVPLFLGVAVACTLVARSITTPLSAFTKALRRLAEGEIATAIPELGRRDEIGQKAAAAGVFRDSMVKEQALAADQLAERGKREERAHWMEDLTRSFDQSAGTLLQQVDGAAAGMREACRAMSETAVEAAEQAGSAADAAQVAAANVQTVAAATEELSASIGEIGGQVTRSAEIAGQAVSEAERTDRQIRGLAGRRRRSARSCGSFPPPRSRRICWRSTRPSRRRGRAHRAAVSPWWPPR